MFHRVFSPPFAVPHSREQEVCYLCGHLVIVFHAMHRDRKGGRKGTIWIYQGTFLEVCKVLRSLQGSQWSYTELREDQAAIHSSTNADKIG